jgi:PAS domain S-box-containing protein
VLNGENKIRVEIERQRHIGDNIPCIVTTFPLEDEIGHVIGIIEQFRDITEIRHKDEEIKESEDRYRALIELGN